MLNEFWGEIISVYSDADAIDDGVISDISELGIEFNGKPINRITDSAEMVLKLSDKTPAAAKTDLQFIADNSEKDRDGADAWGIFQPRDDFGNEKLWLVGNEIDGYTLMLPSDY